MAAYGGPRSIMEKVSPARADVPGRHAQREHHSCMAAGIATLKICQTDGFYDNLHKQATRADRWPAQRGERRRRRLPCRRAALGGMLGMALTRSSRFVISRTPRPPITSCSPAFSGAMLDRGVWLPPSGYEAMFVSAAHDDAAIDTIVAAARASFKVAAS